MTHSTPQPSLTHDYSRIVEIYSLYEHFLKAHGAKNICVIKIEHGGSIKDFENHNNQELLEQSKQINKICILSLDYDLYHLQYNEYQEGQIEAILSQLKHYDLVASHNLEFQFRLIDYLTYKYGISKYQPNEQQQALCTMNLGSEMTSLHIYRGGKKIKKWPSLREACVKLNLYNEIESSQGFLLGIMECLFYQNFIINSY